MCLLWHLTWWWCSWPACVCDQIVLVCLLIAALASANMIHSRGPVKDIHNNNDKSTNQLKAMLDKALVQTQGRQTEDQKAYDAEVARLKAQIGTVVAAITKHEADLAQVKKDGTQRACVRACVWEGDRERKGAASGGGGGA